MNCFFHPKAAEELNEAVLYYEDCQPGLGLEFAEEIYATIARISEYPTAWTALSENTRRCLVNRFPYGVIFHSTSDMLYIIAIANLHRRPGYWEKRL
jgi:hypothetical protein